MSLVVSLLTGYAYGANVSGLVLAYKMTPPRTVHSVRLVVRGAEMPTWLAAGVLIIAHTYAWPVGVGLRVARYHRRS